VKRVFIDTNVPMYWAGEDSQYKSACGRILSAVASGEIEGVTDAEVLQEILYRYSTIGKKEIGWKIFDGFHAVVDTILPVTEDDISLARHLQEQYDLRPRDLVHAAVMLNAGIKEICTVDRHFDRIAGISRIDPLHFYMPR